MFRTVPLSIIRSSSLYTQQWCMSYSFALSLRAGSGGNCRSVLILLASCQQTCMTYTTVVCTLLDSWWWTEELSETCRFLSQNKIEKLVYLFGFIIRIYHNARSRERQIILKYVSSGKLFPTPFVSWLFVSLVVVIFYVFFILKFT